MAWLYAFEAKEIQKFIMRGDKLREMVGGSELINRLCGDFLNQTLGSLQKDVKSYVIIAQAAGWARIRFDSLDDATKFSSIWPLLVNRFAPGIQVIQSVAPIADDNLPNAIEQGAKLLLAERNKVRSILPEIGPLVERAPRTGLAAVEKNEFLDGQSARKLKFKDSTTLIQKITGEDAVKSLWPEEIDKIAGNESSYVAIIHADGNDLGKCLIKIGHYVKDHAGKAADIYAGFSRAIEEATTSAAQKACKEMLLKDFADHKREFVAARPIVLGGDDLTIIVRANLAFDFAAIFLEEFELSSTRALQKHLGNVSKNLPDKLTACAGMAFVKKTFPFAQGYELAESLCSHTKKIAKQTRTTENDPVPSSFAFHRVTTSMTESYETVIDNELTARHGAQSVILCQGPYGIGKHADLLPTYENLKKLVTALDLIPSGSVRSLLSTIHADLTRSQTDFNRVLQVADEKCGTEFKKALLALTGNDVEPLWSSGRKTPLKDAYEMRELLGLKDKKRGDAHGEG